MATSHLTLSDPERQIQGHSTRSLIFQKGVQLNHMIILNISRKPYVGSPMAPSDLTFRDLDMSNSRSLISLSVICRKGA